MVNLNLYLWLAVSMMYLFAAVYFKLVWGDKLPDHVPLAYFTFGSAIFFSLNTGSAQIWFLSATTVETLALISLAVGWFFGYQSVRVYVRDVSKYVPDDLYSSDEEEK